MPTLVRSSNARSPRRARGAGAGCAAVRGGCRGASRSQLMTTRAWRRAWEACGPRWRRVTAQYRTPAQAPGELGGVASQLRGPPAGRGASLREHQGPVSLHVVDKHWRPLPAGGGVVVLDHRSGDVDDLPVPQAQAPGEIEVLVVHEVAGVEAAGVLEGRRTQQGAARRKRTPPLGARTVLDPARRGCARRAPGCPGHARSRPIGAGHRRSGYGRHADCPAGRCTWRWRRPPGDRPRRRPPGP